MYGRTHHAWEKGETKKYKQEREKGTSVSVLRFFLYIIFVGD